MKYLSVEEVAAKKELKRKLVIVGSLVGVVVLSVLVTLLTNTVL